MGLAACSDKAEELESLRASLAPDLVCDDVGGLWPAELATRTGNAYADRSARPDQFCLVCLNFRPGPDPRGCGTCVTVRGPISPAGWCRSWTAKRA